MTKSNQLQRCEQHINLCVKTGLLHDRQCGMSNADRGNFKKVYYTDEEP